MIFAGINSRILAGPLANPLHECNRLIDPHRAAGIMTIFFEIKYEQDTRRSRRRIGLLPRSGHDAQEMIGLPDRIGRIAVVIGAPEQPGPSRCLLSHSVIRIARERRITGFVDHAQDAFGFHPGKIDPHRVVVRQVHNRIGRKSRDWQRQNR